MPATLLRHARPWAIAFGAPAGLPPLRHVLPGMNAHINYDLPQAIVAVTQLQAPGQVILKLAATGFGVKLPGPDRLSGNPAGYPGSPR